MKSVWYAPPEASEARSRSTSDLDLVLIEATDLPFAERGLRYIGQLGFAPGVDLLVYTPEEFERMRARGNGFIETIDREGVTVYEG